MLTLAYYGSKTIFFLGPKIWEVLSNNIEDSKNRNIFKSNINIGSLKIVHAICAGNMSQIQDLFHYNLFQYINIVLIVVDFYQLMCLWVCVYMCVYVRLCIRACAYMSLCIYVCLQICVRLYLCECVYLYIFMYACFYPVVMKHLRIMKHLC